MNPTVIILVLLSAFLHVFWNTLGKNGTPSKAFFFIGSLVSVIVFLPFLFLMDFNFSIFKHLWVYLATSGLFMTIYYSGLAGAYRTGDMSLAYPLARALPVLFVPLVNLLLGRFEGLTLIPLLGMLIVFMGCLLLPQINMRRLSFKGYFKAYLINAVLAALGTTGYTLLDSQGMEVVKVIALSPVLGAIYYFTFQMIFVCIFLGMYILISNVEKVKLLHIIKKEKFLTISAGLLLAAAYIIILICYPMVINVSYITAFRQISIPLGAIAGIFVLKERWSVPKVSGALIIFVGLLIVYLK